MSTMLSRPTYDATDYGNKPGDGSLRVAGVAVSALPVSGGDLPSALSTAAKRQQPALALVRDLWIGTERVRAMATTYLPKAPGEDPLNYTMRLQRSVFFNVLRKTIEALVGFVFRKEPQLQDDVPPTIVEHWENIDNAGTHGAVFCRDLMQDAELAGHAAILVDYPNTGGATLTLGTERALGVRPYWVPIKKENIYSWRVTVENGVQYLAQVVLRECVMRPDGAFGEREQVQYRVLYRTPGGVVVGWQLLEVSEAKVVTQVDAGIFGNQVQIPLVEVATSGRRALFESDPPHADIAFLNIAHYQGWSDYATSIHKTCVPIYVETGFPAEEPGAVVVIGPNTVRRTTAPDAKAYYVSHSGQSLNECKQALDDLIRDMATLGIAALANQKRAAETAESKQIDKAATDSQLSVSARSLQDALEEALDFHARYLKLDDGGSIVVNRDFENLTMQADMLSAYASAVASAGIPVRLLFEQMQLGGLIGEDVDLDTLEQETFAAQAAQDEQQRLDAQAALAAQGAPVADATA